MNKIVALCSGGFDSIVLLHKIREDFPDSEIHTLFFDYGQKSKEQEYECVVKNSEKLNCIPHRIGLPVFYWTKGQFYSPEFSGSGEYLEMRNLVLLSYALSWCESLEANYLYMATLKSLGYYDTSEDFLCNIRSIAKDKGVEFITPFSEINKIQLSYLAYKYHIGINDFFTCDNPVDSKPCGECPDCLEIKKILQYRPLPVERFLETGDLKDPEFHKRFRESHIQEIRLYTNHKCRIKLYQCQKVRAISRAYR